MPVDRLPTNTTTAITETPGRPSTTPSSTVQPLLLFADAASWEEWLSSNLDMKNGAWLRISKKGSEISSVSYQEALDVALCYGWIDGQRKALDDKFFLQRFTPRRRDSLWSKRNVERVNALKAAGRLHPAGIAEVNSAVNDGRWDRAYLPASAMPVPADFQVALTQNDAARDKFETLTKSQRYSFLWRIETTKRLATRQRKIASFVGLLAQGESSPTPSKIKSA